MPRKLDETIATVLRSHGFGPEACWDCHGTWVVYHRVLEQIAAKAGITYAPPQVLVADRDAAAILVVGTRGDHSEWSIGEAVVGLNYKVSGNQAGYPFAMAEKRAKDRVILKLIGLTGLAYSEEEADDFKREPVPPGGATGNKATKDDDWTGPLPKTALVTEMRSCITLLGKCANQDAIDAVKDEYAAVIEQCQKDLPGDWAGDGGDIKGYETEIELACKRALDPYRRQAAEYIGAVKLAKTREEAGETLTRTGYDDWIAEFRKNRKPDADALNETITKALNAKPSALEAA